jgi:hypothetical protein
MPDEGNDQTRGDKDDEAKPRRRRRRSSGGGGSTGWALQPFEEAQLALTRGIQEAWAPAEPQRRLRDAFDAYATGVARSEGEEAVKRAYRQYVEAARELQDPDRIRQAYERAYREYVAALKAAWTEVEPTRLDPASLAAVGQAVGTGAALVASVTRESVAGA